MGARVFWFAVLAVLILKLFQPPAENRGPAPLFSDSADGATRLANSPDSATTRTLNTMSEEQIHGGSEERERAQNEAYRALRRSGMLEGNLDGNRIGFGDLIRTRLYRRPPPIFPARLDELEGKTVVIRGFMSPYDSLTDLRNFMLVQMPTGCYFCAPPGPTQVAFVRVPDAEPLEFINEAIDVEGTLSLWKSDKDDPAHEVFLFVINDAKLTPVKLDGE